MQRLSRQKITDTCLITLIQKNTSCGAGICFIHSSFQEERCLSIKTAMYKLDFTNLYKLHFSYGIETRQ